MLKYLRIAVSVACLAACLLLVKFWARSRTLQEAVYGAVTPARALVVVSDRGTLRSYTVLRNRLTLFPRYGTVSRCHMCCHDGAECAVLCDYGSRRAELAAPYWSAVLVSTVMAAAPWMRWRFSLRTLLIATTLAAIFLGAIVASN